MQDKLSLADQMPANGEWGIKTTDGVVRRVGPQPESREDFMSMPQKLLHRVTQKIGDTVYVVDDSFAKSRWSCFYSVGCCLFFFVILLLSIAAIHHHPHHHFDSRNTYESSEPWLVENDESLATSYANLIVQPVPASNTSDHVHLDSNSTEYISSSLSSFLHSATKIEAPPKKIEILHGARRFKHHSKRDVDNNDTEIGDSLLVNTYHHHHHELDVRQAKNEEYVPISSIDSVSVMNYSEKVPVVNGKLLLSVFNGTYQQGSMRECLSVSEKETHLRSPSVYVQENLLVGNQIAFKVHFAAEKKVERNVFLPMLSASADFGKDADSIVQTHVPSINSESETDAQYSLNVGSKDVHHVVVHANHSISASELLLTEKTMFSNFDHNVFREFPVSLRSSFDFHQKAQQKFTNDAFAKQAMASLLKQSVYIDETQKWTIFGKDSHSTFRAKHDISLLSEKKTVAQRNVDAVDLHSLVSLLVLTVQQQQEQIEALIKK